MTHSGDLANHQLQRLLQAGLATHVIEPSAVNMTMDTALAELQLAGSDCITALSDGRIAFSALHPLPEPLVAMAKLISETQPHKPDQKPLIDFHSRRGGDPAMLIVEQLATCVTQISKGQALINRLTYRFHVMELALSKRSRHDPEAAGTIDKVVARIDDMQAQIRDLVEKSLSATPSPAPDLTALVTPVIERIDHVLEQALSRPVPRLDMTPLHTATSRQTAATASILKRLENISESLEGSIQRFKNPVATPEPAATPDKLESLRSETLPDELMNRLSRMECILENLQNAASTTTVVMPAPELQRESFARFGVALQAIITRVETLAGDMAAATDLTEFKKQLADLTTRLEEAGLRSQNETSRLHSHIDGISTGIEEIKSVISALPGTTANTSSPRESFARFGTALNTAISRLEKVSTELAEADHERARRSALQVSDGNLFEFLDDLRFVTAELVACSLINQAKAS